MIGWINELYSFLFKIFNVLTRSGATISNCHMTPPLHESKAALQHPTMRIKKDRLYFLPKVQQLLGRPHVVMIEVGTLSGLVAQVMLDTVISTPGLTQNTPSAMYVPANPVG